jgi:hypothetical protein
MYTEVMKRLSEHGCRFAILPMKGQLDENFPHIQISSSDASRRHACIFRTSPGATK